jgi:NAD(P)-dependent dehydrogenase (short-subunit alcohol dehydrogenase family)
MGRVLLITGSSGIAAATARLATRRGDTVFLIGKNGQECAQLSSELNDSAFAVADLADENAVKDAIQVCLTRMNAIDAVFNVAGISGRSLGDGPLHGCTTEAWQSLISIHGTGAFFLCREVIRHWMSSERAGIILNTSTVLARFPEPTFFAIHAYAANDTKTTAEGESRRSRRDCACRPFPVERRERS